MRSLLTNPLVVVPLSIILAGLLVYLRDVGPQQARRLERIRRFAWPRLDHVVGSPRPLVRDKTDSDEVICTVEVDLDQVAAALWDAGYRWNPLSTKKYRVVDGQRQYAALSVAWRSSITAATQHHVYLFATDAGVAVWGHQEANVTDVDDHDGGDELVPGDDDGRAVRALRDAGLVVVA